MTRIVKYLNDIEGNIKYDIDEIYWNDVNILTRMVGQLFATLKLVKLSSVNQANLVSFTEFFEWRTPLGQIVAENLTKFRDGKLKLITDNVDKIMKERF